MHYCIKAQYMWELMRYSSAAELLSAITLILISLTGFQSSSRRRSVSDRRVNQVVFNLVEKLPGLIPIIIMSSLLSVSSPHCGSCLITRGWRTSCCLRVTHSIHAEKTWTSLSEMLTCSSGEIWTPNEWLSLVSLWLFTLRSAQTPFPPVFSSSVHLTVTLRWEDGKGTVHESVLTAPAGRVGILSKTGLALCVVLFYSEAAAQWRAVSSMWVIPSVESGAATCQPLWEVEASLFWPDSRQA